MSGIDEKMLSQWAETLRPAATGTFPADDARELIRLVRLGLWAERHGIPSLTDIRVETGYLRPNSGHMYLQTVNQVGARAIKALAALPKEKDEV